MSGKIHVFMSSGTLDFKIFRTPDLLDGLTPSAWGSPPPPPPPPAKLRFGYAIGYSCTIIATKSEVIV